MKSFVKFIISTFLFLLINQEKRIFSKPIIGILTNPIHNIAYEIDECYVDLETVKWLESAGAEIVPIHLWYSNSELDEILNKVNGILFQSGTVIIKLDGDLFRVASRIIKKVIEEKDQNNRIIPLLGNSLGLELIHSVISGSTGDITYFSNTYSSCSLIINQNANKDTKLYSLFSSQDIVNLNAMPVSVIFSLASIDPDHYNDYKDLNNFFIQTALGFDADKKSFVASIEAKNYPIYGVQFNPEIISYSRLRAFDIPKGIEAVRISQNLANFFVNTARSNDNKMTEEEKSKFGIINTFEKQFEIASGAEIYKFVKGKNVKSGLNFLE